MLINGYVEHHKVGWDFEDESPGRDARGFAREGAMPPEIETHLVNTVLTNGARYYVDHAHPEYSTPECSDALELVCADKAGERILARSMLAARRLTDPGQEIVVYIEVSTRTDVIALQIQQGTITSSQLAKEKEALQKERQAANEQVEVQKVALQDMKSLRSKLPSQAAEDNARIAELDAEIAKQERLLEEAQRATTAFATQSGRI